MLGLGAATRVFVATGATDMRLGFNGLYALVAGHLKEDPQSGHLFLFANKRRDRMKILFFDNFSLWVCARRRSKVRLVMAYASRRGASRNSNLCSQPMR
jgi:transposase